MDLIIVSNSKKMDFEETSYFSNVRKNDQKKFHIFGKDFSVKKPEKKIKKKQFFNFFRKKILFDCFFFHGKQTNWIQN